eukprot:TRINITY_DN7031_c0_g1_i1.p1 TRINITY_DN7031_c0_g1~~TRINITY_DN7031_c0_g1_i1.p1  ORF type:complete len:938 (-),score=246.41 TRINITY_DN7031_c0_g1_i1:65-2878(-)
MKRTVKKFDESNAPANYIPGLGRGATGFITRSDIGSAGNNEAPTNFGAAPAGYVAGRGRGAMALGVPRVDANGMPIVEDDGIGLNSLGDNDFGIFDNLGYDEEDDKADAIWNYVDERMDSRRRERREAVQKKNIKKMRKEIPKIQRIFAKDKEELKNVSFDEWLGIQDIGDRSLRFKKKKWDRYTPAPDSLIEFSRRQNQNFTSLDAQQQLYDGFETPGAASVLSTPSTAPSISDINHLGKGKQSLVRAKLEIASDSVTGQTSVDPRNYLNSMSSKKLSTTAEVGDKKRARDLFKSITKADPKNAKGWISRALLEEEDGKIARARKIISMGYVNCPKSESVWIQAARLHPPKEARTILSHATNAIPDSIKIWMTAANLETETKRKKRVLRKALEQNPTSSELWKAAVVLEKPKGAKMMLERALEYIPDFSEFWIALAKLQPYEDAKKVLNQAIYVIPTDRTLWITGAQLEEANDNLEGVEKVIRNCITTYIQQGVNIDRDEWLKEAMSCEKMKFPSVAQAIIRTTIGLGLEDDYKIAAWIEDAERCISEKCIQCAKAIFSHATKEFQENEEVWSRLINLERHYGTHEDTMVALAESVHYCKQSEKLWLRFAMETWEAGDFGEARKILKQAFKENPDNEEIWLTAVKLESENKEYDYARNFLEQARENAGTARIWMKSAQLERELGNNKAVLELLTEGLRRYPIHYKMWLMLAQYYENNDPDMARKTYIQGIEKCPKAVELWIGFSRLEEKLRGIRGTRAILEKARIKNPKNELLWLETARNEMKYSTEGNKLALNILSRAIKECPNSGLLWSEMIELEDPKAKKQRCASALERCETDGRVLVATAKMFWEMKNSESTQLWLERAITEDPNLGDAWAAAYAFALESGDEEKKADIMKRCQLAEPKYGEKWISVSKDLNNTNMKTGEILEKVVDKYYQK